MSIFLKTNKILAIYKPKGPTSNDLVQMIKKITNEKVGHGGTLDPLASGVLVVGIGKEATKKLKEIIKQEKEYITTIKLGVISETDDEEGKKKEVELPFYGIPTSLNEIKKAVKSFVGKIKQIPPLYSAVKIKGKEAYKYARKGQKINLKPREVEIKSIEILDYKWPFLKIKVITGPGVYIRALARDIGEKLKVGGYLADLERIRVGNFTKENSLTLEQILKLKQINF